MNIRYRVELSETERAGLIALLAGGKHEVRKLKRAQILWAAEAGVDDETIAKSVGVGGSTVYRTKRRFVEGNLEAALNEEPRRAANEAHRKARGALVATACSAPPKGRKRWTLELLAGEMVKLTEHDGCRARPSAGAWPRMISSPGAGTCGASLRSMECMSPGWKTCSTSTPKGMIQSDPSYALMKARTAHRRGSPADRPSWASRNAMIANTGAMGRLISLSSSTRIDLGAGSRSLNSVPLRILPHACAISSISITLTPMSSGSFSTISRPIPRRTLRSLSGARSAPHLAPPGIPLHAQARQLAEHGRNRNRRLRGQCLDRRIDKKDRVVAEIDVWEKQRNEACARINWMFTTERARTKLARAYPDTAKES